MNKLEKTAILSVIITALLSMLKFWAGITFGSVALIADGMHSFTDIISSVTVFFGIRFSQIKSKKFPYGLYKIENLVSLFISVLIFISGFEILSEAFSSARSVKFEPSIIPIFIAFISLLMVYFLAKYKQKVGKEKNSPSMIAEGKHSMMDAYSTLGVLIAVILSFFGFFLADFIVSIVVVFFIFKAGFEIFLDSVKVLIDASLDLSTMQKIEKIVLKEKKFEIKKLIARNSGSYVFVELYVETKLKDLEKANKIIKEYEKEILKKILKIDKIIISLSYTTKEVLTGCVPLEVKREDAKIFEGFSSAPYFAFFKFKKNEKEPFGLKIIKNSKAKKSTKKGILTANFLIKKGVDTLFLMSKMSKGGGYYTLKNNIVKIRITSRKNLKDFIKNFKKECLEE